MAWGDQYKAETQTLLRFFVAITKEQRRSHVILATSECAFQTCLSKERQQQAFTNTPLAALLHPTCLRPYSHWAADIDAAAFGPRQRFTVVTAPTPLHLYLMEEERSTRLAPLDPETQQVSRTSNTNQGAGPSRPPSPTSVAVRAVADEIAAVQCKIEDVERQIQQVSDEITGVRRAKGEGWQDEWACLQQEKQQLIEDKRQLCEKERLLQEEKLLLMKREE